jgi:hypothetical protein
VNEKYVLVGSRLRLKEVAVVSDTGGKNAIADAAVLLGRKNVAADRQIIGIAVNKFERKHSWA